MITQEIKISDYKNHIGGVEGFSRYRNELPNIIQTLLPSLTTKYLEMYNLNTEKHSHGGISITEKVYIFLNATQNGAGSDTVLESPLTIGGITNDFKRFLAPIGDTNGVVIKSEHGVPIAEWRNDKNHLNIFFNLFKGEYNQNAIEIFKFILSEVERTVFFPKTLENSWLHTQNKEKLTKRFNDALRNQKQNLIRAEQDRIIQNERAVEDYKKRIKQATDALLQGRRLVETEQAHLEGVLDGLNKDLDLMVAHEKIKDVHIKDGKFTIFTHPLIIHAGRKCYYGGEYRIEIIPEQVDVKFFGTIKRRGHWSAQDTHPHVSSSGSACLGNASSMIAECCSQMQIYALSLICIDFLESANTADPAGAKVINWDECTKEGKLLKDIAEEERLAEIERQKQIQLSQEDQEIEDELNENSHPCDDCGVMTYDEDITRVYDTINDNGDVTGERYVCGVCLDNYTWDDETDEYILTTTFDAYYNDNEEDGE